MSAAIASNDRPGDPAVAFIKLRTGANGRTRRVLIPTARMIGDHVRRVPFGAAPEIAAMKKDLAQAAELIRAMQAREHI